MIVSILRGAKVVGGRELLLKSIGFCLFLFAEKVTQGEILKVDQTVANKLMHHLVLDPVVKRKQNSDETDFDHQYLPWFAVR